MNKNISFLIAVVIIGAVFVSFNFGKYEKVAVDNTSVVKTSDNVSSGTYETYSESKLALAETGKVVLFFRASWCPTCKAVDSDIRAHLGLIPEGVHILDVNYDDSALLKKKYGVTYQHTFVQVNKDGDLIKKWSGSPTLSDLVNQMQ